MMGKDCRFNVGRFFEGKWCCFSGCLWLLVGSLGLVLMLYSFDLVGGKSVQINEVSEPKSVVEPIIVPGSLLDTGIKVSEFEDVDRESWSFKYIQQIAPIGVIPPVTFTKFDPQGKVTRLDMAKFLLRTYELITKKDPPIVKTPFEDIGDLTKQEQNVIAKIYGLGITAGTTSTTFSPDDLVNRAQMVTFFCNLYRAITGEYPPESEVPFTDIEGVGMDWAIKYIKRSYNLKITAGISEDKFGPKLDTTREQMAAFIFNFMRLFGPSWDDPNLAKELAETRSVVFDVDWPNDLFTQYSELKNWLPEIKQTGFNTIRLIVPWKQIDPQPLLSPTKYNQRELAALIKSLELLKQNGMRAIIGLNSMGETWAPSGIDFCRWSVDLEQYQAFEDYVEYLLVKIQDYSDIVDIYVFTEYTKPCELDWKEDAKKITAILRSTVGSLPQRLPIDLRQRFKIGYHDHVYLSDYKVSGGELPLQMPSSYDFHSLAVYHDEYKTDSELISDLDQIIDSAKHFYPFTPLYVGEYGVSFCDYNEIRSSNKNQARVLGSAISYFLNQEIGFNIWQWQGMFNPESECAFNSSGKYDVHQFGIAYLDDYKISYWDQEEDYPPVVVSKPARTTIQNLLNPDSQLLTCIEDSIFAQKVLDENHKICRQFPSDCIPDGWKVVEGINDCSEACTGRLIWTRLSPVLGGTCEGPFPSDCIPLIAGVSKDQGYQIDPTCNPQGQAPPSSSPEVCAQVITWAKNNQTGECRRFSNACLPDGWEADLECRPAPSPVSSKSPALAPTLLPEPTLESQPSSESKPTKDSQSSFESRELGDLKNQKESAGLWEYFVGVGERILKFFSE